VQYEYEAEEAGEYKLCVQLTEDAFTNDNQKVRAKVKFSAEFHRSKSFQKMHNFDVIANRPKNKNCQGTRLL